MTASVFALIFLTKLLVIRKWVRSVHSFSHFVSSTFHVFPDFYHIFIYQSIWLLLLFIVVTIEDIFRDTMVYISSFLYYVAILTGCIVGFAHLSICLYVCSSVCPM